VLPAPSRMIRTDTHPTVSNVLREETEPVQDTRNQITRLTGSIVRRGAADRVL